MDICLRVFMLPISIPTFVKRIICVGSYSWKYVTCTTHINEGHDASILGIAWQPSGKKFVTCSRDETIKIWKEDGTLLHNILKTDDASNFCWVTGISWHPSGNKFVTCSDDKCIKIWDEEGTLLHTIHNEHNEWMNGISWHPSGKKFVTSFCEYYLKMAVCGVMDLRCCIGKF